MSYLLVIIHLLFTPPDYRCLSTIFGQRDDKYVGGKALHLKRRINGRDRGIAHRRLPLGTAVLIRNPRNKLYARGIVLDRGPYGAYDKKGRWFVKKPGSKRRGKYRGCIDLTPALANAIKHNGMQRVELWVIR